MKVTESALRKYIRERVRLLDEAQVTQPKSIPAQSTAGYVGQVGGMAGAAAVIMAIEAKQPKTYSYTSAGVGSQKDDLLVTGGGISISIEVKYGATMGRSARFDITSGKTVANKLSDILVFVVGSNKAVDFVVAHTSTAGKAFANSIFGTTNANSFKTKNTGKITYSGKRKYITLDATQMISPGGGKLVKSTTLVKSGISEGEAHMIAFSEYCKTSAHNIKMAALVAPLIGKADGNAVIALQCKFDSDFNSCLTSIHRKRDDRWLPVIPDWTKAGNKYAAFSIYFSKNKNNFTNNETKAVVHDYSTGGGGKGKGKGKNVNKPTGNLSQDIANAFGLTLATVDAIINGAPSAKAFDELFGNLTSTGKIGVAAAKAFIAAGDPAFLIELIQAGIDQKLITKAAAKLILEEYKKANALKLSTAGTLKVLYDRINTINLTPNKSMNVTQPTTKHLNSLSAADALLAINTYREASGWKKIKNVTALAKVAAPTGDLNGHDYSNAVRFNLSSNPRAAQLFESLDSVYDEQRIRNTIINNLLGASQVTQAVLGPRMSDLLREDEFELPDDFTAKTDIEFYVRYNDYALSQVEEALNFAAIDLFDFVNELEESITALGEVADSKEIYARNVPDAEELGLEPSNTEPEPEKLDSEKIDTDDMDFSALDQIVTKSPLKLKQQKIDADDVLPPYQINDLPTSAIQYSYQDDDPQEVEQVMQEIRQKMVRRLIREVLRKKLK